MSSGPVDPGELPTPPVDGEVDATIAFESTMSSSTSTPGSNPSLQGFELVEELGRGGMGVVFKARDEKLDRTVALKMILGGQFASDEEVRRFQLEAESAARLDHPHIVPIYETGESNGNHFFSMKLVDGQPLSSMSEAFMAEPRTAVALMIDVAKAVHHAHQRGILHRDLKPANILVDSKGHAWLTDLGLAKQIDDESGLTQTGLVMGSPGFMSPEQAAGKSDVTTSADVYALGAILYWLIAGRPPFAGDTALDVILQTVEKDPQSLQTFVPNADRDLNLICQKALKKNPQERYVSAEALAADLCAWLDGEALSVKPPTAYNLAKRWVRKNFRAVAFALGLGILCGLLVGLVIWLIIVQSEVNFAEYYYPKLGETSQTWIRHFGWLQQIPSNLLRSLPFLICWTTTLIGVVLIGLMRPKSREVGIAAAATAALLAGIVSYTISLGWGTIVDSSVEAGKNDIELISDAFWMTDEAERALATRALLQRYPGLEEVDSGTRGGIVQSKIIDDQRIGIPWGMWLGIASALCLTVLPLFCSALFAGFIWEKGHRKFAFYGMSFELGIYSALFFLLAGKWVPSTIGSAPDFGFQIATMSGILLSIGWALWDAKLFWRILGFAIATVCVWANMGESQKIDNAATLAWKATTPDEYNVAAEYFEKKIARNGGSWERFCAAILFAYSNDDEKYRQQCEALLSSYTYAYRANVAERIAKVCLIKPELLDNVEQAHELAEMVCGYDSSHDHKWLSFVRAMSEMRKGNLAETIRWSQLSRTEIESDDSKYKNYFVATTHLFEALAQSHAGNVDLAKASLELADQALIAPDGAILGGWPDRVVYLTLRREADSIVDR